MIGKDKVLAIIPARGGSKGLPRKNLRDLGGRPVIAWSIDAARSASTVDRVILSSDDPEIIAVARRHGCEAPFVRPAELATDTASMLEVVHHAVAACGDGFQWIVLLQPTSPLRSGEDIDATLMACVGTGAPACVTVTPAQKSPFWMFFRSTDGRMRPVIGQDGEAANRRQDLPEAYALNGAVYAARSDWLRGRASFMSPETICHVMPGERSIDIDSQLDLAIANALLSVQRT